MRKFNLIGCFKIVAIPSFKKKNEDIYIMYIKIVLELFHTFVIFTRFPKKSFEIK